MSSIINNPPRNIRVTYNRSPNNARSESSISINPLNPYNMIAGSKRFTNPSRYEFSLAVYSSFDGGFSWNEYESLELQPDWTGTSDPALAWDGLKDGNAYLVALPFGPDTDEKPLKGMAAYTSSDGGMRWSSPKMIHESEENELDDKQWAAGDVNPTSPYYGNVYAVWDGIGESSVKSRFARTTDRGKTWKGISNKPSGSALPNIDDSNPQKFQWLRMEQSISSGLERTIKKKSLQLNL